MCVVKSLSEGNEKGVKTALERGYPQSAAKVKITSRFFRLFYQQFTNSDFLPHIYF